MYYLSFLVILVLVVVLKNPKSSVKTAAGLVEQ